MSAWEGSEWQRQREEASLAPPRGRQSQPVVETPPIEQDQFDQMREWAQEHAPLTPEQEAERLNQLVTAILRRGASGRVQVANVLFEIALKAHKRALDEKKMGRLEEITSFFERIAAQLDGTEDWTGTMYPSRESFDALHKDLVMARDLLLYFDKKAAQTHAMVGLVREIIDGGVKPAHAPVMEDRARR